MSIMSDQGQQDDGAPMSGSVYEMFWDCPYCGTTKLLGKAHRHCPSCGSAQDSTARYFPPDEEKVAVHDHVYYGRDWNCEACQGPNSNKSTFCGNCGSPRDGAAAVVPHSSSGADPGDRDASTEGGDGRPKKKRQTGRFVLTCGCLFLVLLAALVAVALFWTTQAQFSVDGEDSHRWERSIAIEQFKEVRDGEWCDLMPSGATDVKRSRRERSTEQVAVGEECTTVKTDLGDGTYTESEDCSTVYEDQSIDDDWCEFDIERWTEVRTEEASGKGIRPRWPTTKVSGCARLGCTRGGKRIETYTLQLLGEEGETHACDLPEDKWSSIAPGATVTAQKRVLTGAVVCSSL